jgi:transposase
MTARKEYSKEFELDTIALVVEQKYSRVEAARNLGINSENSEDSHNYYDF